MIATIVYIPLAIALAVLFLYSLRGAILGYGKGRLIPFTFMLGVALFGSLYLMLIADVPWAAVAVVAVVTVPLLTPVTLIVIAAGIAWLSGKPMRWN